MATCFDSLPVIIRPKNLMIYPNSCNRLKLPLVISGVTVRNVMEHLRMTAFTSSVNLGGRNTLPCYSHKLNYNFRACRKRHVAFGKSRAPNYFTKHIVCCTENSALMGYYAASRVANMFSRNVGKELKLFVA
jgi:hypothetical protein